MLELSKKQLEKQGYYIGHYSEEQMEKVVTGRAKYREKLE